MLSDLDDLEGEERQREILDACSSVEAEERVKQALCPKLMTSATYSSDEILLVCRDQNLFTAFSIAALKGSPGVLNILFRHGETNGMGRGYIAVLTKRGRCLARKSRIDAMWNDILHSADLTQSSLLHLAVKGGHLPVRNLFCVVASKC